MKFKNVIAEAKANLYFDGKVISHKITLTDGSTKTLGVMFHGDYHFGTEQAERMEITDGECTVIQKDSSTSNSYKAGQHFDVPANSGFSINVASGTCQYVCSYID